MSLGMFWSVLNPLIMMTVLSFVFVVIYEDARGWSFPAFVMCGLIPFNFFNIAWSSGTVSLLENASLIKRVPVPREIIPIASVLSNCLHLLIQLALLAIVVLATGYGINRNWLFLPVVWGLYILFVSGMVMACSALSVYVRDMRYVVESLNAILFWLVPIFYGLERVPARYAGIYELNPIAAIVLSMRSIFLNAEPPRALLMLKLSIGSLTVFLLGWLIFRRVKAHFYDYL